MSLTFIHTADWQLGKPYQKIQDNDKRAKLKQARIDVIARIAQAVRDNDAKFVVVAGDLFDSPTPTNAVVSAACGAIGKIGVPVYVIPGNHDYGGPGSLWQQDYFEKEREKLAPNLVLLDKSEEKQITDALLYPCPLLQRHESQDTTLWLRQHQSSDDLLPRIVIAHGTVQQFGSSGDDEDGVSTQPNYLELERLPAERYDYIALGDWHGTKQINDKAWYAGTPETDRFVKGGDHDPGNILIVSVGRGQLPQVTKLSTSSIRWNILDFSFDDQNGLDQFRTKCDELSGQNVGEDMLRVQLSGRLGLEGIRHLDQLLEVYKARSIDLRVQRTISVMPTKEEIEMMTTQSNDPLIAKVAAQLLDMASSSGENAPIAKLALEELYFQYKNQC